MLWLAPALAPLTSCGNIEAQTSQLQASRGLSCVHKGPGQEGEWACGRKSIASPSLAPTACLRGQGLDQPYHSAGEVSLTWLIGDYLITWFQKLWFSFGFLMLFLTSFPCSSPPPLVLWSCLPILPPTSHQPVPERFRDFSTEIFNGILAMLKNIILSHQPNYFFLLHIFSYFVSPICYSKNVCSLHEHNRIYTVITVSLNC